MVKHDNKWGTVCDDRFTTTEAFAACRALGFNGNSYSHSNPRFSESIVPIWMDEVDCDSAATNFLECSHNGWGKEDCTHPEDVILDCNSCQKNSIQVFSNCEDCSLCTQSNSAYSGSRPWPGNPIRKVF